MYVLSLLLHSPKVILVVKASWPSDVDTPVQINNNYEGVLMEEFLPNTARIR